MTEVVNCPGCVLLAEGTDDLNPDDLDRAGKRLVFVVNNPDRVHPVNAGE